MSLLRLYSMNRENFFSENNSPIGHAPEVDVGVGDGFFARPAIPAFDQVHHARHACIAGGRVLPSLFEERNNDFGGHNPGVETKIRHLREREFRRLGQNLKQPFAAGVQCFFTRVRFGRLL